MKQPFKYQKEQLRKVMSKHHGIAKIDLSDSRKTDNTINNILKFLSLDQFLKVTDATSYSNDSYVEFSLESINATTTEQFQKSIKIVQAHLDIRGKQYEKNAPEIIALINSHFDKAATSGDKLEYHVGRTDKDEHLAKVQFNLPNNWIYIDTGDIDISSEVREYYKRNNYYIDSHNYGDKLFAFTVKRKEVKEPGCFSVILLLIAIVVVGVLIF